VLDWALQLWDKCAYDGFGTPMIFNGYVNSRSRRASENRLTIGRKPPHSFDLVRTGKSDVFPMAWLLEDGRHFGI
jgi:hypothetical protein